MMFLNMKQQNPSQQEHLIESSIFGANLGSLFCHYYWYFLNHELANFSLIINTNFNWWFFLNILTTIEIHVQPLNTFLINIKINHNVWTVRRVHSPPNGNIAQKPFSQHRLFSPHK